MSLQSTRLLYVPIKNFGDALNPWIWKQLLPGLDVCPSQMRVGDCSAVCVCSIGSFLSEEFLVQFSGTRRLVVAGTGIGYGEIQPRFTLGRSFPKVLRLRQEPVQIGFDPVAVSFAWVRGPLTARKLGLQEDIAVADAAYLIRQVLPAEYWMSADRHGIAFMPHIGSVTTVPWQDACERLGWRFIDPRSPLEGVLDAIRSTKLVVTEALHGAIVADALRTPWIATRSSGEILDLKWRDHCAAIEVNYAPIDIRPVWYVRAVAKTQRNKIKQSLFGARALADNLRRSVAALADDLRRASEANAPLLSSEAMIRTIDTRLREGVERARFLCGEHLAKHPRVDPRLAYPEVRR